MPPSTQPPHPGPAPTFEYPFGPAEALRAQLQATADGLSRYRNGHDQARAALESATFEGISADNFRSGFDRQMDDVERDRREVMGELDRITTEISAARDAEAAHQAALGQWRSSLQAHTSWTPPVTTSA